MLTAQKAARNNRHTDVKRLEAHMERKLFTQSEVNKIVKTRLTRERGKLTKEFEAKLRRRMTSVQRTLQELFENQDNAAITQQEFTPQFEGGETE